MWRKIGCAVLIIIVIALIGGIVYQQTKGEGGFKFAVKKKKKSDEAKEPNFEPTKRGDLTITVEATGTTEPISDIQVKSEATGRITEFYVKEGDRLHKGDVIAKLDQSNQQLVVKQQRLAVDSAGLAYEEAKSAGNTTQRSSLETSVRNAEAGLDNARKELEKATADYDRIAELHGKGYATDQELANAQQVIDGTQNAVNQAQSALDNFKIQLNAFSKSSEKNNVEQARLAWESAKVQLAQAEKQLGNSVIHSPIDGIVLEKPVDVGDSVTSINSAFGEGTTIVKAADLSRIKVRTSVDEVDIGKIKVGQEAKIDVDAHPGHEFSGKVTNVFPQGVAAQGASGLVSFIAIVEVDNADNLLLGNMTANVRIVTDTVKDALLVPLAATRVGKEKDETIVYVLKPGEDKDDPKAKTEERKVKLGDTDFVNVVVIEGLKEGELVKVRGFDSAIQFG